MASGMGANVPPHQFGNRGLQPAFGVIAQKLLVGQLVHSWKSRRETSFHLDRPGSTNSREDFFSVTENSFCSRP
jgi:hypothetical protein